MPQISQWIDSMLWGKKNKKLPSAPACISRDDKLLEIWAAIIQNGKQCEVSKHRAYLFNQIIKILEDQKREYEGHDRGR